MDFTRHMMALLGAFRRERNGAVADAMTFVGVPYGLNYGVSLPTLRQIARKEVPDHEFASYLLRHNVRELRLAALHIAQPERFGPEEFAFWGGGIINSEVAEEAAFALLSRSAALPALFDTWIADENLLLQYAALMAASRCAEPSAEWIEPAVEAVRRAAADLDPFAARMIAQGAVALLAAIGSRNGENRLAVLCATGSLGKLPAEDYVHEELAWRL